MSDESKNISRERAEDQQAEGTEIDRISALEAELTDLRQQLVTKEGEAKDNYDRFVRQTAELDNFKKRASRDREDGIRFANEVLIKDLLPIVDNLERAVAHASGGGNGKPLVEGVEMVLKGFLDVLSKHGVRQIVALGQSFDPGKHEAMAQLDSESHAPNSVIDEHQRGYFYRERLLRPALVTIAKGLKTNEKKNEPNKVENDPTDD
ncbi:MAG TPA: nucleotide exchange factor GrpE [Verrucomicrobiae bacterium]|nr:nucleotide exchange factor GrpE [Verrucomicrobiae bacterium]